MAWDAKKVSDYVLHRRRVVIACFGLGATMIFVSGIDFSVRFAIRQAFTAVYVLAMLAFFGSMAVREWKLMKASPR